ncbi:MAG: tyrosine-type recombinase/integrase [Phyllobacteriaceae bacterium]|nr:tyrosine-type recombinase/integrase [Phyllobacteriaceae bacterium]
MNEIVAYGAHAVPALVEASGEKAIARFLDYFTATIRNRNTRRAYGRTVTYFLDWCQRNGLRSLRDIQPIHVSAYIEQLTNSHAAPTPKQTLSALRMLFDFLVTGQIIETNPAHAVRGPKHSVRRGKTAVLSAEEARKLLDSIEVSTPKGLRDRALIAIMVYSFGRIGAVLSMKVEDAFVQKGRLWVRLHEKGGKDHEMPCHHNLETYLNEYIERCGLRDDPKGFLFRTTGRKRVELTPYPLAQANAYTMIGKRALEAGIMTKIGNHSFRATGITAYLKNGGTLERAAIMANHASTRTTQLYDRRSDDVTLDEVEKISV